MPSSSRRPRSVEYVTFAEVVHGRWVRYEVEAPSPQAALDLLRQMKFDGQVVVVRKSQAQAFPKEER